MLQTLDIISVNIWQILISLANLLIMYLILKKFLFGPVQKVLATRQKQVDDIYGEANKSRESAESMRQEYEEKLATARDEADGIVRSAVQTAQRRSDTMVSEAAEQVSHMKQKAASEIAQEKKQMLEGVRSEISDIAVEIASRIVGREVRKEDHESFVDDFIRNVGEQQ
ncbi:MAG: F0F1 ATP synthase subunit B [Clostridiales bacterium]|nr:F0F1 ATP synthase subunit B [Clostridiales bacterium]